MKETIIVDGKEVEIEVDEKPFVEVDGKWYVRTTEMAILDELEEWLKENIKLKPLQTTYFFKCDGKQKSISEIELNELKKVLDKIIGLKEKYK